MDRSNKDDILSLLEDTPVGDPKEEALVLNNEIVKNLAEGVNLVRADDNVIVYCTR